MLHLKINKCIYNYVFTQPLHSRLDEKNSQQNEARLNSEFSFFQADCLTKAK